MSTPKAKLYAYLSIYSTTTTTTTTKPPFQVKRRFISIGFLPIIYYYFTKSFFLIRRAISAIAVIENTRAARIVTTISATVYLGST